MSVIARRSVTHVVLVLVGVACDRRTALVEAAVASGAVKKKEKKSGGGFKGMMGAIKAAAENSNRRGHRADKSSAPPKEAMIMTMSSEVKRITRGNVPAEMFAPPVANREVKRSRH